MSKYYLIKVKCVIYVTLPTAVCIISIVCISSIVSIVRTVSISALVWIKSEAQLIQFHKKTFIDFSFIYCMCPSLQA